MPKVRNAEGVRSLVQGLRRRNVADQPGGVGFVYPECFEICLRRVTSIGRLGVRSRGIMRIEVFSRG